MNRSTTADHPHTDLQGAIHERKAAENRPAAAAKRLAQGVLDFGEVPA